MSVFGWSTLLSDVVRCVAVGSAIATLCACSHGGTTPRGNGNFRGDPTPNRGPLRELRAALTVDAYDEALGFYRDSLKLPVDEIWDRPDGRGVILDTGHATLEILSKQRAEFIDRLEVGKRAAGAVRLGFEVGDATQVSTAFLAGGGERLAGPVTSPSGLNTFRMRAPDGMQYSLFTSVGAKSTKGPVRAMRFSLTVDRYDEALRFYRDAFGLPILQQWDDPAGGGTLFDAGNATLELLSKPMAESVDRVEVGRRVAGPVRVAVWVDDSDAVGKELTKAGAEWLGGPVATPWLHKNVRVRAPDGMQFTLFSLLPGAPR
ncbi:VOC family protein [Pendulispora brunnea]|uniref:VOC family protein n=1 Tax=Pendulispora brunnea TaxID=2905690 RepID=A0ABZ2JUB1_9BACT